MASGVQWMPGGRCERMTRLMVPALWAGIGLTVSAAPQTPSPPQQSRPSQVQKPFTSVTGCVHQAVDQPTLFALQRIGDGSAEPTPQGGQPQGQTGQGQAAEGQAGKATGTAGSPGAESRSEVAWYRLLPEGTLDLKQYKGLAVQVTGSLVPGKDGKGAEGVVHRIPSAKGAVTANELAPAPQLRIQSISPLAGARCPGNQDDKR
jgi:hypothetical protein